MFIKFSKFLKSKMFKLLFIYAGFSFFLFIYSFFIYVTLNILHSVTALTNLSSVTSLWFSTVLFPYFLINNILSSPVIFNLQLISPMF